MTGSTHQLSDAPRYVTLRDYLRVLRERRLLILAITVLFTAAAVLASAHKKPVYQADAALSFQDTSADATLLGTASFALQTPEQLAARSAEIVGRRDVAVRVQRALGRKGSIRSLQRKVSGRVEATTNLVVILGEASTARGAARLANEFARQTRSLANDEARRRFAAAAATLRRQQKALRKSTSDVITRATYADRITRLESLAQFAQVAQTARPAVAPASPVSPKPVRDGILGALIGLTLGILAAFIRDSLDRRLRSSREIQEQLHLPMLASVRTDALGRAGGVANGRGVMSAADLEAFRILRTNLEFLDVDDPVRSVVVTSALPEEGKSTVAASLALAAAAAGRRTLLVECDLRRPVLAKRFGVEGKPGLVEFLTGQVEPRDILRSVDALPATADAEPSADTNGGEASAGAEGGDQTPKLVCIFAGGPAPRAVELLGSKRFETFLEEVRQAYDLVVLDSSPLLSVVDTLEILPRVDGVLVCVRASRTTRDQARAAKAAIDHLPERPAGLVVTGVRSGDEADYGYYYADAERS